MKISSQECNQQDQMRRHVCLLDDAPFPRLCHIKKWPGYDGYGFSLQGMPGEPGHFANRVVPSSPADYAGLKEGDRLIEVNGQNIESLDHMVVIEGIRSIPRETTLLVADAYTCNYYRSRNLVIDSSLPNVRRYETPDWPPREGLMKPRFCLIKKRPDFIGFGFTIQSDLNRKNPVVAQVDPESPAERGGLRSGDKVVEVNDVPVYKQRKTIGDDGGDDEEMEIPSEMLLSLIRASPDKLKLLVIEESNYEKFVRLRSRGLYKDDQIEVIQCSDEEEQPKRNEQITFSIESPTDSIGRRTNNSNSVNVVVVETSSMMSHSTPKPRQSRLPDDDDDDGTKNDAFVSDDGTENISPVKRSDLGIERDRKERQAPLPPPPAPPSPSSIPKENGTKEPIGLKYCQISSERALCFGFNVVAEKWKLGNYFENVERGSAAQKAGLVNGDHLVAVNGSLVCRDDHQSVVEKIKRLPYSVAVVCTDAYGFERLCTKSEPEIEELIERTLNLKALNWWPSSAPPPPPSSSSSSSMTDGTKKPMTEEGDPPNDHHEFKAEDDSFSIDYKQIADEMVELALNEAKQDNIKLRGESGEDTLKRTNQFPKSLSAQSLEKEDFSDGSIALSRHAQDYSSLPSSSSSPAKSSAGQAGPRPVVIAGVQFAATAAEARRNMKKKRDFKNTGMTLADKYELLKGL